MHACRRACAKPCSMSPTMMGGQGNCQIIKRCTSPKPMPKPGCKWVKRCSPSLNLGGGFGITTSPVIVGRRRHHRFTPRRFTPRGGRRISPYATTVIGRGRGPIRRVSVSPIAPQRRVVVSPRRK